MKPNEIRSQFASDNYAGICPEAWEAMATANTGYATSYGDDPWTDRACGLLRELFETDCEVYFVFTGVAVTQTVDMTAVTTPDFHFTLVGGSQRDVVIGNDATINGQSILDFDAAADGRRFLVSQRAKPPTPPLTVVVNWRELLGAKTESP